MAWTSDDDHQLAEVMRRRDAGEDDCVRPGEMTVPGWVMASIVLGLVALTGSMVAVILVAVFGTVWWLLRGVEPELARGNGGRPDGKPGHWPGAWL